MTTDTLIPTGTNVKPLLHYFDQYQTYDLLVAVQVFQPIVAKLIELFANCFPVTPTEEYIDADTRRLLQQKEKLFRRQGQIFLFDRFTPVEYPWAADYSRQIFEFYKPYSALRILQVYNWFIGEKFNGNINAGLNSYGFVTPANYRLPIQQRLQIEYTPPADETITFTWFRWENSRTDPSTGDPTTSEDPEDPDNPYTNPETHRKALKYLEYYPPYKVASRKQQVITVKAGIRQTITLDLSNFLVCSMVVAGSSQVPSLINQINKSLLYENLVPLLNSLKAQIDTQCPLLRTVVKDLTGEFVKGNGEAFEIIAQPSATFVSLPDWYFSASLIYANNNYWQNGAIAGNDLGKPCTINTFGFIDCWGIVAERHVERTLSDVFLDTIPGADYLQERVPVKFLTDGFRDTFKFTGQQGRYSTASLTEEQDAPPIKDSGYLPGEPIRQALIYFGGLVSKGLAIPENEDIYSVARYSMPFVASNLIKYSIAPIAYLQNDSPDGGSGRTLVSILCHTSSLNIHIRTEGGHRIWEPHIFNCTFQHNIPEATSVTFPFKIEYVFFSEQEIEHLTQLLVDSWKPIQFVHHLELERP